MLDLAHDLTRRNLPANGESRTEGGSLRPRAVSREMAKVLTANGYAVKPAMLRCLVSEFIGSGHTTVAEVEPYLMTYADPTGESAVRNVSRGGRSG